MYKEDDIEKLMGLDLDQLLLVKANFEKNAAIKSAALKAAIDIAKTAKKERK